MFQVQKQIWSAKRFSRNLECLLRNRDMAKESMKARERKRQAVVAKYAKKREALKAAGD